jgi:hypothetical protein
MIRKQENHLQKPLQQQQTPKAELVCVLKKYIHHCKLVSINSHSDFYRTMAKAKAWDMVSMLNKDLMNSDNIPMHQLKTFTLMIQHHLREILPNMENTSYKKSIQQLEQIINLCKK